MPYPFRVTYRASRDLYIEDRGFAHEVRRDDPDFEFVDAEFGPILAPGQTAQHGQNEGEWEVVDGFPLLEALKSIKHERLKVAWLEAESRGVVRTDAGFAIDANERANRDIVGLITRLEATGESKTSFCAADNSFHEVSLNDLRGMLLAIIAYGEKVYARKWLLREAINQATTPAELDAIQISFAELD